MVCLQQKCSKEILKLFQREAGLVSFSPDIAIKFAEEHLVHCPKEALDPATPLGFSGSREYKADLEIDGNLLYVLRSEIGAVVGVKNFWNAADMPMRVPLPPYTLSQRECRSHRRWWIETKIVAGNGTTVVVNNDSQPRSRSLAVFPYQEDAQLCVVRLPDSIGSRCLAP